MGAHRRHGAHRSLAGWQPGVRGPRRRRGGRGPAPKGAQEQRGRVGEEPAGAASASHRGGGRRHRRRHVPGRRTGRRDHPCRRRLRHGHVGALDSPVRRRGVRVLRMDRGHPHRHDGGRQLGEAESRRPAQRSPRSADLLRPPRRLQPPAARPLRRHTQSQAQCQRPRLRAQARPRRTEGDLARMERPHPRRVHGVRGRARRGRRSVAGRDRLSGRVATALLRRLQQQCAVAPLALLSRARALQPRGLVVLRPRERGLLRGGGAPRRAPGEHLGARLPPDAARTVAGAS